MDESKFDQLARAVGMEGSRRRLLGALTGLGLGGVLTAFEADNAGAEKPRNRLQRRTSQHRRKRRNEKRRNQNTGGTGNGNGVGDDRCGAIGDDCTQDGDCCSKNCFDFACAAKVRRCGTDDTSKQCLPPAKGCAGDTCCYGPLACGETCCAAPANQCNPQGACCVPNCAGRQCGDDGCGAGGTCGSCAANQVCDAGTGQCVPACSQATCPNGCCDANGRCQTGTSPQACGRQGETCRVCSGEATCVAGGVCRTVAGTCTVAVETCGRELTSPCNANDFCSCDVTVDGAKVCRSKVLNCQTPCATNADCGANSVCVSCLNCRPSTTVCVPVCSG